MSSHKLQLQNFSSVFIYFLINFQFLIVLNSSQYFHRHTNSNNHAKTSHFTNRYYPLKSRVPVHPHSAEAHRQLISPPRPIAAAQPRASARAAAPSDKRIPALDLGDPPEAGARREGEPRATVPGRCPLGLLSRRNLSRARPAYLAGGAESSSNGDAV